MSCFTGCDVNSRTAPRWVTGDLMLTVIRTLGGKCYTAMFPGVVLSHSLAAMSLWLRSLEAENQTDGDVFVFKRCRSVFCFHCASLQVKGQSGGCKRCECINLSVAWRPRKREKEDSDHTGLHKTGFSHTMEHVLVPRVFGTRPRAGVYTLTRSFSGYRKYSTRYRAALTEHRWRWHLF